MRFEACISKKAAFKKLNVTDYITQCSEMGALRGLPCPSQTHSKRETCYWQFGKGRSHKRERVHCCTLALLSAISRQGRSGCSLIQRKSRTSCIQRILGVITNNEPFSFFFSFCKYIRCILWKRIMWRAQIWNSWLSWALWRNTLKRGNFLL